MTVEVLTHTHLLCDADGDDRGAGLPRGQRALSFSATWQRLLSRSKEVSLLICVSEATTLQGHATMREQNLRSSADIYSYTHALT